jgi:hypothetical protein
VSSVSDPQSPVPDSHSISDGGLHNSLIKKLEKAWHSQGRPDGRAQKSFAAYFGRPRLSTLEQRNKYFSPVLFVVAILVLSLAFFMLALKKLRGSGKPAQASLEPLLQAHVV